MDSQATWGCVGIGIQHRPSRAGSPAGGLGAGPDIHARTAALPGVGSVGETPQGDVNVADQEAPGAPGKTVSTDASPALRPDEVRLLEPSEAELDDWVERERRRREAWLQGPTADERLAYARRLRERRLAELETGSEAWLAERARTMGRMSRETQLAVEGALSLFLKFSRRSMAQLVEAGRAWEEEFGQGERRRRVPIDDEDR
jgi:hypothetical protein